MCATNGTSIMEAAWVWEESGAFKKETTPTIGKISLLQVKSARIFPIRRCSARSIRWRVGRGLIWAQSVHWAQVSTSVEAHYALYKRTDKLSVERIDLPVIYVSQSTRAHLRFNQDRRPEWNVVSSPLTFTVKGKSDSEAISWARTLGAHAKRSASSSLA